MSNNMVDKNVSDKVVWESGVTPDKDCTPTMSQLQSSFQSLSQSQMMFCYKCNNVIPADSKFCPYCHIELYTICPTCGVKYSSQYPGCNQCGTNRLEYIETQRREILRQEKLEQERQEQERKEALEKERIMNTREYQSTYSILKESLDRLDNILLRPLVLAIALLMISAIVFLCFEESIILIFGFVLLGVGIIWAASLYAVLTDTAEQREQYILQYLIKNNCDYNKDMLNYVLSEMRGSSSEYVLDKLSEWCIEAYRKQYGVSN